MVISPACVYVCVAVVVQGRSPGWARQADRNYFHTCLIYLFSSPFSTSSSSSSLVQLVVVANRNRGVSSGGVENCLFVSLSL
jgi:hypothetical protein